MSTILELFKEYLNLSELQLALKGHYTFTESQCI